VQFLRWLTVSVLQVYFIYMATNVWKLPQDPIDRFCVGFLICSAIACFSFSTCYHTLLSVSDTVARRALVLDVLGIVSLILGSFVAGLRVGFYCSTVTASLYLVATVLMLGTAAAMMVVPSLRDNPALGPIRTMVLAGTVAWGLVPATHWILIAPDDMIIHAFTGLASMFLLYAGGFLVFSLRLPERFSPGSFDILFASHQWWHLATVLAALVWTTHILLMYEEFLTENATCDGGSIQLR
jgi:adiponectin receptor